MNENTAQDMRAIVEGVYRAESRRVFATLIRLLGDFDAAEEALHDAFRAALEQWPKDGVPANPRAWLVSAGRFKAIDALRRNARFESLDQGAAENLAAPEKPDAEDIEDDRLRLIFTCCHPALAPDAQVALTLREVCGLTTEEIAAAFLTGAPTLAQRIVRAKSKIRDAKIPYQVPAADELRIRLDSVLRVIYLVFNEGYSSSAGESLTRQDMSGEAIRLARLLVALLPEPEAMGLLALMLLHESRRMARTSVVELNRAVAVAMRDGPQAGLSLVDTLLARGELADYRLAHAARADLCRRLGQHAQARASYRRALELTRQEPERRFIVRRLTELNE